LRRGSDLLSHCPYLFELLDGIGEDLEFFLPQVIGESQGLVREDDLQVQRGDENAKVAKELSAGDRPGLSGDAQSMLLQCRNLGVVEAAETCDAVVILQPTRHLLVCFARDAEHRQFPCNFSVVSGEIAGIEIVLIKGGIVLVNPVAPRSVQHPAVLGKGDSLSDTLGKLGLDGWADRVIAVLDASSLRLGLA
jgi:hypothetical protein